MTGLELIIGLVLGGLVFAGGFFAGYQLSKATKGEAAAQFSDLANRIFEERNKKFKEDSKESLGAVLGPLRQDLESFRKKVEESYGEEAKERRSLRNEVRSIVLQTEGLTNALKGNSKVQGDLGEMLLEKLLEDSGLQAGANYSRQESLRDEEGALLRPDYIINMPDGRHVIIDAKMPLTHYERYAAADNEDDRKAHGAELLKAIEAHVKNLAGKEYFNLPGTQSPDFVLMFVPLEGAFMLALQTDPALHGRAWERRVIIVSATTLMATLRTVGAMWRLEGQNRNAQEIARQAGGIYDKFAGFMEKMQDVEKSIKAAGNAYDAALERLTTGRGNVAARLQKLKALGAKTAKSMPDTLQVDDEDDDGEDQARRRIDSAA
ncbi:MAG: DNA recombination protein RmuC [Alphaproteobacteria bacterium]|nr:DNA recombination protein RmuC [Alphaproteobacteria bacterium]